MNYVQKNRLTIIVITAAVLFAAALLAIWFQRGTNYSSDDLVATVTPTIIKVGDSIVFEDKTPFTKSRKWAFGDGYDDTKAKGTHFYTKTGTYTVSLMVNNKYQKTFTILVTGAVVQEHKQEVELEEGQRLPSIIDGPTEGMQFRKVFFRAQSNGNSFSWKFGVTGRIDDTGKSVSATFDKPGTYVVELLTDVDPEPIRHTIKIMQSYPTANGELPPTVGDAATPAAKPPTVAGVQAKINDDFRIHLQYIADGKDVMHHYKYLLGKYLCNNESAAVTAGGRETNFYNYCMGLQFDKGSNIQDVKTSFDGALRCVIKVDVTQNKL